MAGNFHPNVTDFFPQRSNRICCVLHAGRVKAWPVFILLSVTILISGPQLQEIFHSLEGIFSYYNSVMQSTIEICWWSFIQHDSAWL